MGQIVKFEIRESLRMLFVIDTHTIGQTFKATVESRDLLGEFFVKMRQWEIVVRHGMLRENG